jgi:HAMP domain-containing protein
MKKMAEKTSEIYEVVGEKGDDIRYVVKVTNIYEEFAGLISGTLSAEMVQREINSLHSAGVDNIYIVNNSGAFLSHPDSEKVYQRALSVTDYSKLVEISSREVVDSHAIIKMNFDGLDSFIDFNFLHNTKWGVVTAIEQSGFHENIRRVKEVFLLITIVAIAAGVLLALFVAHSMAGPIASLTRVAARISEGDLSTRCAFRSNDEIGSLASSFNRMLEDLQKARNGLEKKIRELVFAQEEQAKLQKELKILQGIIPICASCKNIRDDDGCWNQMESYIGKHSEAEFSHGICPDCEKLLYPDI